MVESNREPLRNEKLVETKWEKSLSSEEEPDVKLLEAKDLRVAFKLIEVEL